MVTGNRVVPVSQKAGYLRKKAEAIENSHGVEFGQAFRDLLEEGNFISDSTPPSIAFNVFKSIRPEQQFELARAIQKAHYIEGKDLNNIKVYLRIAEAFPINKRAFLDRYHDPVYRKITEDSFRLTEDLGVDHFPTMMLESAEEKRVFSKGYKSLKELEASFEEIAQSV